MRKIKANVFLDDSYPGVSLGLLVLGSEVVLIDCPLRVDDSRAWLSTASDHGKARFMALLDHHPERVLGARNLDLTLVAHDQTRRSMASWSDTFKGSTRPIGAFSDRVKRITGVSRAVPDLSFSHTLVLHLEGGSVHFSHHPGPTKGAMWVVSHDRKVIFIGDAVTQDEPPYVGDADLDAWLQTLDEMRQGEYEGYRFLSSRDGPVNRDQINAMARFLRMVQLRVEKLGAISEPEAFAAGYQEYAQELVARFALNGARKERALLRLQAGLERLHQRLYPQED